MSVLLIVALAAVALIEIHNKCYVPFHNRQNAYLKGIRPALLK